MAYDEQLADRVRELMDADPGFSERKMFGGLCFMLEGNMVCGIVREELMLRLGPERADAALAKPGVRQMDFTGRPMTGMVFVEPGAFAGAALADWVEEATAYVRMLPPKKPKPKRA